MDHRFRNQFFLAFSLILFFFLAGMIMFSWAEGWGFFDSFYYTGITLTTIGFGDMVPTTIFTKTVTVIYGFLGIGLVFYSMNLLARQAFEKETDQIESMLQRRLQHKLAEEKKTKEEVQKEAQQLAKEVEKEAVKIAKEITEKKR